MKKVLTGLMFTMLFLVFGFDQSAMASDFMTKSDITDKMVEINDKYEVGDILSDEDAEFVKEYGYAEQPKSPDAITPFFSYHPTYVEKKTINGVTATISGSCDINHWNPIKNTYDCQLYGKTNLGTVSVELEHTAYGALGTDGKIGKIYTRVHNSQTGSLTQNMTTGNTYSGLVSHSLTVLKAHASYGNTQVTAKAS